MAQEDFSENLMRMIAQNSLGPRSGSCAYAQSKLAQIMFTFDLARAIPR